MKLIDLTGQRFGSLEVIARSADREGKTRWIATCVCGRKLDVGRDSLRRQMAFSDGECHCKRLIADVSDKIAKRIAVLYTKHPDEWQRRIIAEKMARHAARGRC